MSKVFESDNDLLDKWTSDYDIIFYNNERITKYEKTKEVPERL